MRDFQRQYEAFTNALLSQLKNILDNPISLLDYEIFKSEAEVLSAVIDSNKKVIQDKIASPATTVGIDSIYPVVQRINTIIIGFNTDIKRNNDIVQNQALEKSVAKSCYGNILPMSYALLSSNIKEIITGKQAG